MEPSESFTLNQSPSDKNSLIYSFQGQMTSNFPTNLKDTQSFHLRDINHQIQLNQASQATFGNPNLEDEGFHSEKKEGNSS